MIEQGPRPGSVFDPASLSAPQRPNVAGYWPRVPQDSARRPASGSSIHSTGGGLNKLLALLVALTLACGAVDGVTCCLAPAATDDFGAVDHGQLRRFAAEPSATAG